MLQVVIRCFINALRYAFLSDFEYSVLKTRLLPNSRIVGDFLIRNWFMLNVSSAEKEVDAAMWRQQVEEETFNFTFFEEVREDMKERLLDKEFYTKK